MKQKSYHLVAFFNSILYFNYFNSQSLLVTVVCVSPFAMLVNTFVFSFDTQFAWAVFFVTLVITVLSSVEEKGPELVYSTPPVTPLDMVVVVVQVQVLSFLQEAKEIDTKIIATKICVFIFLVLKFSTKLTYYT